VAIAENQAQMMKTDVYKRRSVCQGINDAIDIEFTGRGPFYCIIHQYKCHNICINSLFFLFK
jgi:nucleoporin POM152